MNASVRPGTSSTAATTNENNGSNNLDYTLVNASVDPCGCDGRPIPMPGANVFVSGNVKTNEAHRLQFAVKANTAAVNNFIDNPAYVVRVDRFGKNLQAQNVNGGNILMDEFTSNFFGNVTGYDNSIYGGNSALTGISITGNYVVPQNRVFNANFVSSPGLANAPLYPDTNDITNNTSFTNAFRLERNLDATTTDFIANTFSSNAALTSGSQTLTANDTIIFVQANLFETGGKFLGNAGGFTALSANIQNFTAGNVVKANIDGTGANTNFTLLYGAETAVAPNIFVPNVATLQCLDAKVVTLFGSNILDNSMISVPVVNAVPIPNITGYANPDVDYNNIQLYYFGGNVNYQNLNSGSVTTSTSSDYYVPNFNAYLSGISNPNGIYFNSNAAPNVAYDGMLHKRTYGNTLPLVLGSDTSTTLVPFGPSMDFFFYGNSAVNERVTLPTFGNLLAFVGNAYNETTGNILPTVLYNSDTAGVGESKLLLGNSLCQSTPTYDLVFNSFLGDSQRTSGLINANITFAANLVTDGLYATFVSNILSGNYYGVHSTGEQPVLDNNQSLNTLYKQGVAYSDHTLLSNVASTWTDIGNICVLTSSNYSYHTYLPAYGNANLNSDQPWNITSDTFINSILTFDNSVPLEQLQSNIFKFVVSGTQYKSYVSAVTNDAGTPINNEMYLNGNVVHGPTFDTPGNVFNSYNYNADMVGNLRNSPFVSYTYTNMSDMTSREQCYPFYHVYDMAGRTAGNVFFNGNANENDNYLFPGFIYRRASTTLSPEFFNYRSAVDCDFEIKATLPGGAPNTADQLFRLYAVDSINGTIKVALNNDPITKTIPFRPIKWGRNAKLPTDKLYDWYTYITVKLTGVQNTNGNDYTVVFIRMGTSADDNTSPMLLDSAFNNQLPLTITVSPVESWYVNKVNFDAHLAVYSGAAGYPLNNALSTSVGGKWRFQNIDISVDFSGGVYNMGPGYPTTSQSPGGTQLSVKLFSQPLNNSFMTYQFLGSAVKHLLRYKYEEFDKNSALIPSSTRNNVFAPSVSNFTAGPIADTLLSSNMRLAANHTRFYLDQVSNAIYLDVPLANSNNLVGEVLTVYRSLKYSMWRDNNLVNSNVLKLIQNESITDSNGFNIRFNNLSTSRLSSRFTLNERSNQSTGYVSTTPLLPTFTYGTKKDKLLVQAISFNDKNNEHINLENKRDYNLVSGSSLVLGSLFGGVLPTVNFSDVRGYSRILDAISAWPLGKSISPSNTLLINGNSMFRLRVSPDRYIMRCISAASSGYNNSIINLDGSYTGLPNYQASSMFTQNYPVTTDNGDLRLEPRPTLDKDSVVLWLANRVTPNNAVLFANYNSVGLGSIDYLVEDFTGCYDTPTALDEYPVNSSMRSLLNLNLRHNIGTSRTTNVTVMKDIAALDPSKKYYVVVPIQSGDDVRIYLTSGSLSWFQNKSVSLVYPGKRPLVLHRVTVPGSPNMTSVVNTMYKFSNFDEAIFGNVSPSITAGWTQSYTVVLTNNNMGFNYGNSSSASNYIYYRGIKLAHSSMVTNYSLSYPTGLKGWFGSYLGSSSGFDDSLSLNYNTTDGNTSLSNLTIQFLYNGKGYSNDSDSNILKGQTQTYDKYQVSLNGTNLFKILVEPLTQTSSNFTLNFLPSKVRLYPGYDVNGDKYIGNKTSISSANVNNTLPVTVVDSVNISELVYSLSSTPTSSLIHSSPLVSNPSVSDPRYVFDLNNSVNFADGWNNLPNTYLDIKFNKKYSVGYALDTFFIIQPNGNAKFSVHEIYTQRKTNPTSDDNGTELVARQVSPLFVNSVDGWAHHDGMMNNANGTQQHDLSGLTFKLRKDVAINRNDMVRLFCANAPTKNYYYWSVKDATVPSSSAQVRTIDTYDEETYARLLNDQLNADQQLSPNPPAP
jgi:hypothetical protein